LEPVWLASRVARLGTSGWLPLQARAPQPRNLPYTTLGRLFMGREHILPELHERLQQNPGRALAIYGPAGVGKTRLTIEYALRHEAEYTALLAVGASSPEALQRNLAALCGVFIDNMHVDEVQIDGGDKEEVVARETLRLERA
jgi:hypothetical protein